MESKPSPDTSVAGDVQKVSDDCDVAEKSKPAAAQDEETKQDESASAIDTAVKLSSRSAEKKRARKLKVWQPIALANQCFDAVGWVSGRASGPYKSD